MIACRSVQLIILCYCTPKQLTEVMKLFDSDSSWEVELSVISLRRQKHNILKHKTENTKT